MGVGLLILSLNIYLFFGRRSDRMGFEDFFFVEVPVSVSRMKRIKLSTVKWNIFT